MCWILDSVHFSGTTEWSERSGLAKCNCPAIVGLGSLHWETRSLHVIAHKFGRVFDPHQNYRESR
jgi:hypothetical protein